MGAGSTVVPVGGGREEPCPELFDVRGGCCINFIHPKRQQDRNWIFISQPALAGPVRSLPVSPILFILFHYFAILYCI